MYRFIQSNKVSPYKRMLFSQHLGNINLDYSLCNHICGECPLSLPDEMENRKLILLVMLVTASKERIHSQATGLQTLPSVTEGFRIFSCHNDYLI